MRSNVSLVKLGDVLAHRGESITVDDLQSYRRVTAQLHAKGIILRDEVEGAIIKTKKQQVCKAGDFLVAEIDAKLGGFGIVPPNLEGSIVSSHYFLFEIDTSKLVREYLDFFIRTEDFQKQITARGSTNYAAIRSADVLQLEIPLPPIKKQQSIVAALELLTSKIQAARNQRVNALNEIENLSLQLKKVIFFRSNEKSCTLPLKELTTRITKGESPGWQGYQYTEEGPLFITSENVRWGFLDIKNVKKIPEAFHQKLNRSQLKPNDVLVNLVGASIGRTSIVPQDITSANVNQAVAVITPNSKLDSSYLMHFILSPIAQQTLQSNIVESARPNISLIDLRALMIPVPPLPEQRRIVAHLERLRAKVDEAKGLEADTERDMVALVPAVLAKAFGQ